MEEPYQDPYSASDALDQAESVLESDSERARLLLYWVAHNHYAHRDPLFTDWARAKGLARQLTFEVKDRPAELAQTFSIISLLNRRLGLHRDAFLTAMYAFQQQTLEFNHTKDRWYAMSDGEINTRLDGVRRWSELEEMKRDGGLSEERNNEQQKLRLQMQEVPGSIALMVSLFDEPRFPQDPVGRADAIRKFVVGSESSSVFGAASDVSDTLDRVKLGATDHVLLDSMSKVLLSTGPIPVRESPLGWSSNARDMAKIISDLHWKLALKSALAPRQASKYVKIADKANRLYHQLDRPTPRLEQFTRKSTDLCIADLIDERNELI